MRTDIKVLKIFEPVRCPQIPLHSPGRPSSVKRGDLVEWQHEDDTISFRGRVIGKADNFLVVVCQLLNGGLYERWIEPKDIFNTARCSGTYADKAKWFYSNKKFHDTPINIARNLANITYRQMSEFILKD